MSREGESFAGPVDFKPERVLCAAYSLYAVASLISMAAMSIGAAAVAAALLYAFRGPRALLQATRAEFRRREVRQYGYVMAALFLACAISLIGAAAFPVEYGGMRPTVRFIPDLAKAWYLFWPLLLLPGLRALGAESRSTVLRSWILAFGVLSAVGVVQYYVGWPRPQRIPDNPEHFHATLFLGHHLSVASIFIFPFFVALGFLRTPALPRPLGLPRWALLLIVALGAMTLFNTYSRMLWIALPIGLFVWLLWSLPRRASLAVALAFVLALALAFQQPRVRNRVLDGSGIINRQKLWKANWEFFKRRPITGVGWHHNIEISGFYLMDLEKKDRVFSGHAHNNVLDVLSGTGLLGLGAWLAWCGVTLGFLWKAARRPLYFSVASALACAWGVFQLNGLTQVNFWEAKVLHQMMWVVAWSLLWLGAARDFAGRSPIAAAGATSVGGAEFAKGENANAGDTSIGKEILP